MSEHAWAVEEIGGPLGGEFWTCTVCGVGGGPVFPEAMMARMRAAGRKERWPAFIPGPARKVSEDCQEAQQQIRAFIEERIAEMRARWKAETGEHRHYASLFHDALRWNPQITNVLGVVRLVRRVESPTAEHEHQRPSLYACREELERLGFDMSGGAVGQAIRELGTENLRRLRSGEDLEDE